MKNFSIDFYKTSTKHISNTTTFLGNIKNTIRSAICHRLWQDLGHDDMIIDHPWPQVDTTALVQESIEMVIQVNGKLRGKMQIAADADRDSCEAAARANDQLQRFLGDDAIRKAIVVPGKLVNFVV